MTVLALAYKLMSRPPKEAPGVTRLRRDEELHPRLALRRRITESIISANLPSKPARRPQKVATEQEALF